MNKLFLFALMVLILSLNACKSDDDDYVSTTDDDPVVIPLTFETNLSDMGIYIGPLSDLAPDTNVHLFELNSILFTDYAYKQRLIRLPEGAAMEYNNSSLLPIFPDNTIITKTFFYYLDEMDPSLGKKIIETRVMLKTEGTWKMGNYKWNEAQTEAVYTESSSEVPITYINLAGETRNIDYVIPSNDDCITCHNIDNVKIPIGPKLRNLNFNPMNGTVNENQINYFINNGLLEGLSDNSSITVLPDWTDDVNFDIFERGRAYIDINCAHCHQPGGIVPTGFLLDYRLETPFENTGIYEHRGQIESRIQSLVPVYLMPQIGRSVVHDEGVEMMLEYLQAIED